MRLKKMPTKAASILSFIHSLNRELLTFYVKYHGLSLESRQHVSGCHVYILELQIKEVSPFLLAPCHTPEKVARLAIEQSNGELRDQRGYEERHQIVQ